MKKNNYYLITEQILTPEEMQIWQPVRMNILLEDTVDKTIEEVKLIAQTQLDKLIGVVYLGDTFTKQIHICRHETGESCVLIDF